MEFSLVLLIALGVLLLLSLFTVEQQSAALVQRFGKFVRVAHPGLNLRIPLIEQIGGKVNLRVQQLDVRVETKTKDNVFVHCIVSVQYFVRPEKVFQAFYLFDNPDRQITSFVFDVVRARVPKMPIDDVFEKKDEIADAIKDELTSMMDDFGYGIIKTLVTDIEPDSKVKEAMNEINAAQRLRVAASEKAEAERILAVKRAEAEAGGEGSAGSRYR
jgi:regulator of protease activity HflC (stomatin/prohibitin superfamily)